MKGRSEIIEKAFIANSAPVDFYGGNPSMCEAQMIELEIRYEQYKEQL
jgi:hypothetical protein